MKKNNFKVGDRVQLISIKEEDYVTYAPHLGEIFTVRNVGQRIIYLKETDCIQPYYFNLKKIDTNTYDFLNAPIGTKITYKNGDVLIKDGHNSYENERIARETNNMVRENIIKIEEPLYNTIYEHKPEILDKDDKRYIKGVIRPFRDKVKYITKRSRDLGREFISITLNDNFIINLPFFAQGTMYDNMEVDKLYTLEDLNI